MSGHDEGSIEDIQRELHHTLSGMSISEAQQALGAAKKMMEELQAQQERSQAEVLEAKKKLGVAGDREMKKKKKKKAASSPATGSGSTIPRSVPSGSIGSKQQQDIQALLKEAEAAREEMDKARREVDEKLANTQKAMAALDEAKHKQQELGQQLDSASATMGSMNASEIQKLGDSADNDPTTIATTSTTTTESKSADQEDLYGHLPRVVLEVDAQNSLLMAGGQLVVQYTVSEADASNMTAEDVYNDEDTLYLSCVDNHVLKKKDMSAAAGSYPMLCASDDKDRSAHWYTVNVNDSSNDNPNIASSQDLHTEDIYLSGSKQKAQIVTQETAYDALEYTNGMTVKKGVHSGQTTLALPTYAATYVLHYVRTITHYHNRDGSVNKESTAACIRVSKSRVVLSTYEHFIQVPVPLIYGSPHNKNRKDKKEGKNVIASASKWTKRKGGFMQSLACRSDKDGSIFTEDLKHINTISMSITLPLGHTSRRLSRIMAWLCAKSSSDVHYYGYEIVMEMDVCEGEGEGSLNTRYISHQLPFLPVNYQLDVSRSILELVPSSSADEGISIRIPYTTVKQPISATNGTFGTDRYDDLDARMTAVDSNNSTDESISCALCGSALIDLSRDISQCRLLPTGIFDDMMHDFICVEDSSQMNLCSTDITTPQGMLLIGPLMITINPSDVASSSSDNNSSRVVRVDCKNAPSILDLYNGYGGSLATSPFNADSNNKGISTKSMLPSVVNIDTCTLSCARCRAYIGDGQLSSDCTDPNCFSTHLPAKNNTNATNDNDSKEETLSFADIRDVRLSRHCVSIPPALLPRIREQNDYADVANYELPLAIQPPLLSASTSGKEKIAMMRPGTGSVLSIEQAIARSILHLNEVFNVHTFLIHVSHSPMARRAAKNKDQKSNDSHIDLSPSMVIVCRLMGKDYQWTSHSFNTEDKGPDACFLPGLKLSYKYGRLGAGGVKVSGKEARIPVKYHEIVSLLGIFKQRSEQCGAMGSVLKGQTIVNVML